VKNRIQTVLAIAYYSELMFRHESPAVNN